MTTPSIKEALELKPCPFCGGTAEIADKRPKRRTYVTCTSCDTCTRIRDSAQEAAKHWNTRATLSPPAGERREAIARALWETHDGSKRYPWAEMIPYDRERYYTYADAAILASGLVQDEAGISQKLFDRLIRALEELTAVVRGECPSLLNEDSGGDGELSVEIDEILKESDAIRSARNGGAES